MQFKSARSLSRAFVNFVLAFALVSTKAAWATLTIEPTNYSHKVDANSPSIYYASTKVVDGSSVFNLGGDAPYTDPNETVHYQVFDVRKTQGDGGGLSFKITSTASLIPADSTQFPALIINVAGTVVSSSVTYAPIGLSSPVTCSASNLEICPKPGNASNKGNFFYSSRLENSSTAITIYPKDICGDFTAVNTGQSAYGCNLAEVNPVDPTVTASLVPMTLAFRVVFMKADGTIVTDNVDTGELKLFFQSNVQPWSCPSDLANRYFPGDGEVEYNTIGLGGSTATFAGHTGVIAVGKLYSDPSTPVAPVRTNAFETANDFASRVGFGEKEKVGSTKFGSGPMINTTDGTDNRYTIAFMIRDAMGVINPVSSSGTACTVERVQSASIQTFLNKSKCFIATAAFRSVDAAPVEMLRKFRDEVLLPTHLGKTFVDWYYRWSPEAAEWLMEHPSARFPVLLALVPVQIVAWLLLHPVLASLLLILVLTCFLLRHRFRRGELASE